VVLYSVISQPECLSLRISKAFLLKILLMVLAKQI
jgi:hypothetical protein